MFGRKHGVSANGGSHHPSPNVQMVEIVLQIQFVLVRNHKKHIWDWFFGSFETPEGGVGKCRKMVQSFWMQQS